MEFYFEKINRSIASYQEYIKDYQKELTSLPESTAILWEVSTMLESYNKIVYWASNKKIYFYISSISPDDYDEIIDSIEDIMSSYGFSFNMDYEQPSWNSSIEHCFINEKKEECIVEIKSASCKTIKTGKMIPEIKEDCSFIITK